MSKEKFVDRSLRWNRLPFVGRRRVVVVGRGLRVMRRGCAWHRARGESRGKKACLRRAHSWTVNGIRKGSWKWGKGTDDMIFHCEQECTAEAGEVLGGTTQLNQDCAALKMFLTSVA